MRCSVTNKEGHTALDIVEQQGDGSAVCQYLRGVAMSQHTSFFPTSSSPIEMNGEGIYCSPSKHRTASTDNDNDQDMEMGEDGGMRAEPQGVDDAGDPRANSVFSCIRFGGLKRSLDDDDTPDFKKKRLFGE